MQHRANHGGEDHRAARGVDGLAFLVEVDDLQDTGNPQKVLAAPHRETVLNRVDQHNPAHRSVRFGKRTPCQRRQLPGNQEMQMRGWVEGVDLLALVGRQHVEGAVVHQLADVGQQGELARLHLGRARQKVIHSDDVTNDQHVAGGPILFADRPADGLSLRP